MADYKAKQQIPTLYEWVGGAEAIDRWVDIFYKRVLEDPILRPLFEKMSAEHVKNVAIWLDEVFKGPEAYSTQHGGHRHMLSQHLNLTITEEQRSHWMQLMLSSADAANLPTDPEFRSALAAYFEWGSRIAVLTSQPDVTLPEQSPMPHWGWGEVRPTITPDK